MCQSFCWVLVYRYRPGERDSIAPEGAELRVIAAAPSPELEIHHLPSSAANFHKQWQTSCQPFGGDFLWLSLVTNKDPEFPEAEIGYPPMFENAGKPPKEDSLGILQSAMILLIASFRTRCPLFSFSDDHTRPRWPSQVENGLFDAL